MIKFLFLDYRELEAARGFARCLGRPEKDAANPLFVADAPWENGNMQLYGSVLKAPGRPFQMWCSIVHRPWTMYLAYAESDDGLSWRRPLFDIHRHEGEPTNIVLACNPHGPAVLYDEREPREEWRYKLVAGADPSTCICAFRSADGIHWHPVRRHPILTTDPDCPMGFLRAPDGRYAIYHRLQGYGRRVFRSESWDFASWPGEPRMVLEPDAGDPPQMQFYGMGAAAYGSYEVGTLWMYHTEEREPGLGKMRGYQEAELTYARSGYAWHRAAPGTPFIPHGEPGTWEQGNLQCASSPVFLDDEIRYYYMGTTQRHQRQWELEPQRAGLGMARLRPDGFVYLEAGDAPAELITMPRRFPTGRLFLNASTRPGGSVRAGLLGADWEPLPGFTEEECEPITGDSTAHALRWRGGSIPTDHSVRVRVRGDKCRIYSIYAVEEGEKPAYHRFTAARP